MKSSFFEWFEVKVFITKSEFKYDFELLPNYSDFVNSNDCIGKISSISIRKNSTLFDETFIFEPVKINIYVETLDLC